LIFGDDRFFVSHCIMDLMNLLKQDKKTSLLVAYTSAALKP